MAVYAGQAGFIAEATWGTPLVVTRFIEHEAWDLQGVYDRSMSPGIRAGRSTIGADSVLPVAAGAEGTITFPIGIKSAGLFLQHSLGAVATGSPAAGKTPHTFTRAATAGLGMTGQVVRPYVTAAGGQAFTYSGIKVAGLTLSQEVDGFLMAELDLLAKDETTATATATAAYASSQEYFNFNKTTITVGGDPVCVDGWELVIDNALSGLEKKMCAAGIIAEPYATELVEDTITLNGVLFNDLTHYNRVLAVTAGGMITPIIITCTGTADATNLLVITITSAMIMSDPLEVDSGDLAIKQDLEFRCLQPSSGPTTQVQIVYTTTDTAP